MKNELFYKEETRWNSSSSNSVADTLRPCCGVSVLLDGAGVQHSSDLQPIKALHVTDGVRQDLSRAHGGHLPAGLREVAVLPQP